MKHKQVFSSPQLNRRSTVSLPQGNQRKSQACVHGQAGVTREVSALLLCVVGHPVWDSTRTMSVKGWSGSESSVYK